MTEDERDAKEEKTKLAELVKEDTEVLQGLGLPEYIVQLHIALAKSAFYVGETVAMKSYCRWLQRQQESEDGDDGNDDNDEPNPEEDSPPSHGVELEPIPGAFAAAFPNGMPA